MGKKRAANVSKIGKNLIDALGSDSFEELLHSFALESRLIVDANQTTISYIPEGKYEDAIHTHSFSEKYKSYDVMTVSTGIYGLIVDEMKPVRMPQKELLTDKRWKTFRNLRDERGLEHPPMRGWLASPIFHKDGTLIGVIQATDKTNDRGFTAKDLNLVTHLAKIIGPSFETQYVNNELNMKIHELQQTHDSLVAEKENYKLLFEQSPDAIFIHNFREIVDVNTSLCKILGYRKEELIGKVSSYFMHESALSKIKKARAVIINNGNSVSRLQVKVVKKDNSIIDIESHISLILINNKEHLRIIWKDVTEIQQTKNTLQESEEKFRTMSEASPLGIFVTDARGDCTYTNICWQNITDVTFEEALGQGWRQAIHPDDLAGIDEDFYNGEQNDDIFEGDIRYIRKDGVIVQAYVKIAPMKKGNQLLGYLGVVDDVTEKVQAGKQLQKTYKELEDFYDEAIGRELKMKELEEEVEKLKNELNEAESLTAL